MLWEPWWEKAEIAAKSLGDLREVSGAEVMQNPLAATVVEDSDTIIFYFKAKTNSEICNLLLAISTHSEVVFPFILG